MYDMIINVTINQTSINQAAKSMEKAFEQAGYQKKLADGTKKGLKSGFSDLTSSLKTVGGYLGGAVAIGLTGLTKDLEIITERLEKAKTLWEQTSGEANDVSDLSQSLGTDTGKTQNFLDQMHSKGIDKEIVKFGLMQSQEQISKGEAGKSEYAKKFLQGDAIDNFMQILETADNLSPEKRIAFLDRFGLGKMYKRNMLGADYSDIKTLTNNPEINKRKAKEVKTLNDQSEELERAKAKQEEENRTKEASMNPTKGIINQMKFANEEALKYLKNYNKMAADQVSFQKGIESFNDALLETAPLFKMLTDIMPKVVDGMIKMYHDILEASKESNPISQNSAKYTSRTGGRGYKWHGKYVDSSNINTNTSPQNPRGK